VDLANARKTPADSQAFFYSEHLITIYWEIDKNQSLRLNFSAQLKNRASQGQLGLGSFFLQSGKSYAKNASGQRLEWALSARPAAAGQGDFCAHSTHSLVATKTVSKVRQNASDFKAAGPVVAPGWASFSA